jgi:cellobionic acid phosphorylase
LPEAWREARAWRRWRGAEFEVLIRREAGVTATRVILDGHELPENLVPVQEAGTRHVALVLVRK